MADEADELSDSNPENVSSRQNPHSPDRSEFHTPKASGLNENDDDLFYSARATTSKRTYNLRTTPMRSLQLNGLTPYKESVLACKENRSKKKSSRKSAKSVEAFVDKGDENGKTCSDADIDELACNLAATAVISSPQNCQENDVDITENRTIENKENSMQVDPEVDSIYYLVTDLFTNATDVQKPICNEIVQAEQEYINVSDISCDTTEILNATWSEEDVQAETFVEAVTALAAEDSDVSVVRHEELIRPHEVVQEVCIFGTNVEDCYTEKDNATTNELAEIISNVVACDGQDEVENPTEHEKFMPDIDQDESNHNISKLAEEVIDISLQSNESTEPTEIHKVQADSFIQELNVSDIDSTNDSKSSTEKPVEEELAPRIGQDESTFAANVVATEVLDNGSLERNELICTEQTEICKVQEDDVSQIVVPKEVNDNELLNDDQTVIDHVIPDASETAVKDANETIQKETKVKFTSPLIIENASPVKVFKQLRRNFTPSGLKSIISSGKVTPHIGTPYPKSSGVSKSMAELCQDFERSRGLFRRSAYFKGAQERSRSLTRPVSPKLHAFNRRRAVTALSREQEEEIIAEQIKRNNFKATPMNKKIFDRHFISGIPRVVNTRTKKKPTETMIKYPSVDAIDRKDFRATPMPIFKKPLDIKIQQRKSTQSKKQAFQARDAVKLRRNLAQVLKKKL